MNGRQEGAALRAPAYGYTSGTMLGGTDYSRVKVGADGASVEHIDMSGPGSSDRVADRYAFRPADRAGRQRPTPRP